MPVEDVFTITGQVLLLQDVSKLEANTGDAVEIIGMGADKLKQFLQELKCSVKS